MTTELPVSLRIALAGARADLDAAHDRKAAAESRVEKIRTTIAAATAAAATLAEALVESDGAALLAPTPHLSDLASRAAMAEQAAAVARAALPAAQAEIDAAQGDIEAAELHQRELVGTGLAHVRDDLLDRYTLARDQLLHAAAFLAALGEVGRDAASIRLNLPTDLFVARKPVSRDGTYLPDDVREYHAIVDVADRATIEEAKAAYVALAAGWIGGAA